MYQAILCYTLSCKVYTDIYQDVLPISSFKCKFVAPDFLAEPLAGGAADGSTAAKERPL